MVTVRFYFVVVLVSSLAFLLDSVSPSYVVVVCVGGVLFVVSSALYDSVLFKLNTRYKTELTFSVMFFSSSGKERFSWLWTITAWISFLVKQGSEMWRGHHQLSQIWVHISVGSQPNCQSVCPAVWMFSCHYTPNISKNS